MTTGRAFFDEIDNPRDRIIAHMQRDPFEDAERLRTYPAAIAKLLRAATALNPADRPIRSSSAKSSRADCKALARVSRLSTNCHTTTAVEPRGH